MSTCSIGRIALIACACAPDCGPRPKISSREASSLARCLTASAETAAVRTLVSPIPSISATGASVSASNTITTP
jgi:hypothetical protein